MTDRDSKPGAWIGSTIGCFVLAVLLGLVAWWMLSGVGAAHDDFARFGTNMTRRGRRSSGAIGIFAVMGGMAALASLFMGGLGVFVLFKGATQQKKGPAEDNSWRDFPAPSDAPKPGARRPAPPRKR